jgi:hypothetical protein
MILSFACGKASHKAAEEAAERSIESATGDDAEVEISEEGMSVKAQDKNGTYSWQAGDQARVPDDFPSDVHIYEPAVVEMSMDSPDGYVLSLKTDDAPAKVVGVYQEKLSAAGWTKQTTMDMGEMQMLIYSKGERMAKLDVFSEDDVTRINLTASK